MNTQKTVIIVAGGKGVRMMSDIPKQFIPIAGKPVLMHTIEAFVEAVKAIAVVLVLPSAQISYWSTLCNEFNFTINHTVVSGGATRFHSVKNALQTLTHAGLVAIHDGVRPLVSTATIHRCFDMAHHAKAVIPAMNLVDSIRQLSASGSVAVDRSKYKLVQTPQVFDMELLQNAYRQDYSDLFTDDASVVESTGVQPVLVDGNPENIKITTRIDLELASLLLSSNDKNNH